jgi:hypothetical protein
LRLLFGTSSRSILDPLDVQVEQPPQESDDDLTPGEASDLTWAYEFPDEQALAGGMVAAGA